MKVRMECCQVSLSCFSLRKRLQLIRLGSSRSPKTQKIARFTRPLSEFIKAGQEYALFLCWEITAALSGSSRDATVSHHVEVLSWSHPGFSVIPNEAICPPSQTRMQLFLKSFSFCLLRINKHPSSLQDRIKRNILATLYGRLLFSIKFGQLMVGCLISSMFQPWVNCTFILKRSPNQTHTSNPN